MASNDSKAMDQQVEKTEAAVSIKSSDYSDDKRGEDLDQARQLAAQWVDGTDAEKKLVRRLDWRILPCCWVLYLLGFLDRANVG